MLVSDNNTFDRCCIHYSQMTLLIFLERMNYNWKLYWKLKLIAMLLEFEMNQLDSIRNSKLIAMLSEFEMNHVTAVGDSKL